ncbi:MAG: complement C1q domain-containing protein, partial [Phycisphaerae bacterium]|nr:complement C1q domain-containing protein [Phycisphaerae bacterium]
YRLQTPAELRSDTNEPVLTIANNGAGPEINFEGESTLIKYDNDATIDIFDDYFVNIGNSQTRLVGFDSTEDIGHDRTITVDRNESKTVGVNSTTTVTLNRSTTVGAADQTIVGAVSTVSTGGDMNRSAGRDFNLGAGRNIKLAADDEIKTLSLVRMMGADPNQALLVDGVLNLKSNPDFPPANGTYGMLYVKEGKLYYQDDDDLFLITSGGATPQPIYFSVKRDTSYDWPENGTPQVIDFGKGSTVWYSEGGGFDPSTSSFTAPTRGIYSFSGSVHFRNLTGNDQIYAELQCGPRTYRGDYQFARAYAESATVNVTVYLEPGDVVQLRAFVWAVSPPAQVFGNISTTHAFTYFNGAKVN